MLPLRRPFPLPGQSAALNLALRLWRNRWERSHPRGFTGHSGRVGMAQDLAATGVELPALMTAGRWKSSKMPARYTERQAAGRGAVARYYQESGG